DHAVECLAGVQQLAGEFHGFLTIRRSIERVVFQVRGEIARVCQEMADKCGEPTTRRTVRMMLAHVGDQRQITACLRERCNLLVLLPKSN
ncbi:hypothetical protein AB4853_43610, partial [Bradyrhizobium sp. 1050_B9_N1_2]